MSNAPQAIYEAIERERLFAILRLADAGDAAAQLEALAEGGIRLAEISLATQAGRAALAHCTAALGGRMSIGAGTVRTIADAEYAVAAGAGYLVSPGCDPALHEWATDAGIAHLPGVLTPSELDAALQMGAPLVKLFPAGRMGAGYVSDLLAPFPQARLVATGGISPENAAAFLAAGAVAVAFGGALVPPGGTDLAALSRSAARVVSSLAPPITSGAQ